MRYCGTCRSHECSGAGVTAVNTNCFTVDADGLQAFDDDVQNKPVEDVQSLVPHAQLPELTAVPFLLVQGWGAES